MSANIEEITHSIQQHRVLIDTVAREIARVIVGQEYLVERLLLGLLTGEHILLEGVPGLAKTTAVKTLAQTIHCKFSRVQFTPDLLPADLLGTQVYQPKTGEFAIKKGPMFANIVLADEINRAPAKVQSALLEAMQERQITLGGQTFELKPPFMVLATQNPIEQEGTYPLPEAQVDRFMFKLKITYPSKADEKKIMQRMVSSANPPSVDAVASPQSILAAAKAVEAVYVDENLQDYIINLVSATRDPKAYKLDSLSGLIQYGASPRASIYLHRAAKAYAFLKGRGYVVPQDIKTIGFDVLRHRVILSYEAGAENLTSEDVLKTIFNTVEVP
jgi:MoxR-like ATPase